jgi:hypothetical protein
MHPAVRTTLGVVVGGIVAFGLVAGLEIVGHRIYPVPGDIDFSQPEQVKSFISRLPVGAFLLVLASWLLATFLGAVAGSLIARHRALLISCFVGGLVMVATIANFIMIPHPPWMVIAGIGSIALATYVAAKLMRNEVPAR